ncbi:MAG: anti-virulence regulator CigR family protein [Gemmatimonadota bacterium]|nr:anti-virulence regulator CigR family protein [Gemmatimonadota bacterium]
MGRNRRILATILTLSGSFLVVSPANGFAQGHDKVVSRLGTVSVTLSSDMQLAIRSFYSARGEYGVKPLPPGIRKRLARGKPLPPGIAKRGVPAGLKSLIQVPAGYEIVEVGLDVLLVEVATDIIHDVLMDVVT